MTEPRKQMKEADVEAEEVTEEVVTESSEGAQEQVVEDTEEKAEEQPARPLDEVLGQAEKAYAAYMEAQRQVASAYRMNEEQIAKANS